MRTGRPTGLPYPRARQLFTNVDPKSLPPSKAKLALAREKATLGVPRGAGQPAET